MRRSLTALEQFQYMLLLRGATGDTDSITIGIRVSIHAPLARSNFRSPSSKLLLFVSIHAPLARSNSHRKDFNCLVQRFNTCSSCEEQHRPVLKLAAEYEFQYMLLLRGATACRSSVRRDVKVSIHAPLARSNARARVLHSLLCGFQYMLLLRGATGGDRIIITDGGGFNTCSSCEEQLPASIR